MLQLNQIACKENLEYLKQIPDNSVDLVVTDPPYNVSQPNDIVLRKGTITKNFGEWDYNFDPEPVLKELNRVLKPNGQIYIFCGTKQVPIYMNILDRDWKFRQMLIWYRTNPAPRLAKTNYLFTADYIMYGIKKGVRPSDVTFNFTKQNEMHNVIITTTLRGRERLKDISGKSAHPTQKPLSVLKKLILTSSNSGDVVLDVFMGVGSTAVACLQTGRQFIGCEMNPKYVELAKKRLEGERHECK